MKQHIINQVLTYISVIKDTDTEKGRWFNSGIAVGMLMMARDSKILTEEECDEWLMKVYEARDSNDK